MTATAAATTARPVRHPGDGWRTVARGLGQLLITLGVVVLLFVAYELWGTNIYTAQQQHDLRQQIEKEWSAPAAVGPSSSVATVHTIPLGSGVAVLYIPRLGRHYAKVVVEGTEHEDLKRGPGHYPGTALPGQLGNFAVAGHRTTYGAPFNELDRMRPGDAIVLETRDSWYTYSVTGREIVDPTDVAVAYPVPDQPDASKTPTARLVTLTTCNPKYSAAQRLVVHASLTAAHGKGGGYVPPALAG